VRTTTSSALALLLTVAATPADAQPDYRCVVERVHGVQPDSDPVLARERKHYLGREFTVDRTTGTMIGALKNSYATRPQVIDRGSKDNSFKVVTTMRVDQGVGAGSSVYTLVVNEYVESAKKPFVFLSNDVVYYGTCTHFR
jgi:hypothetical protein